jgi:hypothetical protein
MPTINNDGVMVLLPGPGPEQRLGLMSTSIGRLREEPDPLSERAAF